MITTTRSAEEWLKIIRSKQAPSPTVKIEHLLGQDIILVDVTGPHQPTNASISDDPFFVVELVDANGQRQVLWSNHKALARYWDDPDLRQALAEGVRFTVRINRIKRYYTLDFVAAH